MSLVSSEVYKVGKHQTAEAWLAIAQNKTDTPQQASTMQFEVQHNVLPQSIDMPLHSEDA